ncbi:MAG: DUF2920 family protein [Syntrophomonas sp.]
MAERKEIILEPHNDIELGRKREPLKVSMFIPSSGINNETGVILLIPGFNGFVDLSYFRDQFAPYTADNLNCIAVVAQYFGCLRNAGIQFKDSFLYNINRIYGLKLTTEEFKKTKTEDEFYRIIAEAVVQRGITSLDPRCQPTISTGKGEYQSWGLLPAIDYLQALGEVLKNYPVNLKRIIAYGTGYGGYVALLLGKYAPSTFSVIVDRSGYSRAELKHIACGELIEADYVYAFNIRYSELQFTIPAGSNNPWTFEDELSPFYFSDSHRKIRSMFEEKHIVASDTRYYILHSDSDKEAASLPDKDRCVALLGKYKSVYYNRIPRASLQEEQLLNGPHYFSAEDLPLVPDQEVIEWLDKVDGKRLAKEATATDFSENNSIVFDCGEYEYIFKFEPDYKLLVSRKYRERG